MVAERGGQECSFVLDTKKGLECVRRSTPSSEDMETTLYNASAAISSHC